MVHIIHIGYTDLSLYVLSTMQLTNHKTTKTRTKKAMYTNINNSVYRVLGFTNNVIYHLSILTSIVTLFFKN